MKRNRFWIAGVVLALLPLGAVVLFRAALSGSREPFALRPVSTLAELRRQPAVTLANGSRVRLGVSAERVALGDGVVFYALWEGEKWPGFAWNQDATHPLGPVRVERLEPPSEKGLEIFNGGLEPAFGSSAFFAEAVPVTNEGELRFALFEGPDRRIATATIHGTRPAAQAWVPLFSERFSERWNLGGRSAEALPLLSGRSPISVERLPAGILPGLLPTRARRLAVVINGNLVTLSSDHELYGPTDECFLARYWINGQPLRWRGSKRLADVGGLLSSSRTVSVRVNWKDLLADLQPGDRVALQILYSPDGWNYATDAEARARALLPRVGDEPALSDRMEFIYREAAVRVP